MKMTLDQAKDEYNQKIGPIPTYLTEGMDDDILLEKLSEALESGKELEFDEGEDVRY